MMGNDCPNYFLFSFTTCLVFFVFAGLSDTPKPEGDRRNDPAPILSDLFVVLLHRVVSHLEMRVCRNSLLQPGDAVDLMRVEFTSNGTSAMYTRPCLLLCAEHVLVVRSREIVRP